VLEQHLEVELTEDLRGQQLVGSTPTSSCEVRFVVPVRAERKDRVMTLLQSLADQGVAPGAIEVLLVVNNRPDDGTTAWQEVYELNQRLLAEELTCTNKINGSKLVVLKVDQSGPGCWAENCNVGMSRQRGLLEATMRFVQCQFGFQPIAIYEDCVFADTLRAYAAGNGMHFGSGHEPKFGPVTALRISDRTPNSIRKVIDQLDGVTFVDDIFNPGNKIRLTDDYIERLCEVVGAMKGGEDRLHYLHVIAPINNIRNSGLTWLDVQIPRLQPAWRRGVRTRSGRDQDGEV